MPPQHRQFIRALEAGPSVRDYVQGRASAYPSLRKVYNEAVQSLFHFRSKHLEYAAEYISRQSQKGPNPTDIGTGGTPFMRYLKKHREETLEHLI